MMWYAEDGVVEEGFTTTDIPSLHSVMKKAPKVDGMLTLRWEWAYAIGGECDDPSFEGGLTLQCKEPKKGQTIAGEDVTGLFTYGDEINRGTILSVKMTKNYRGRAVWELEVEWDPAGETMGYEIEVGWSTIKDENGFPFLFAEIPPDRGRSVHVVGKRYNKVLTNAEKYKIQVLTEKEAESLGAGYTGSEFRAYANKKYGIKHQYGASVEFDDMTDDDAEGETDEEDDESADSEEDSEEGSESADADNGTKKRKAREASEEQESAPNKRMRK